MRLMVNTTCNARFMDMSASRASRLQFVPSPAIGNCPTRIECRAGLPDHLPACILILDREIHTRPSIEGGTSMRVSSVWVILSLIAAILMAIASAAGVLSGATYVHETVSWAAQGAGQDVVNVLVAFPVLAFSALYVHIGYARAHLIWIGALMYTAYSYVLCAFFVHFGPWFLVYVAILGLSSYALAGAALGITVAKLPAVFSRSTHIKGAAVFLMILGCGFTALWLGDLVRVIIKGCTPR